MENLHLLNEIITNVLHSNFLQIVSLLSILTGISVIIAGYLMILGISFIGLSYLLVYVGAVSILFLFILMLINVRISEVTANSINSIPLSTMIGIFFLISL